MSIYKLYNHITEEIYRKSLANAFFSSINNNIISTPSSISYTHENKSFSESLLLAHKLVNDTVRSKNAAYL